MSKDKKNEGYKWTIIITCITFIISLSFNLISQVLIGGAGLVGNLFVLFAIILLGIVCDMVGVAVTSCNLAPINSMAANKVKGAKKAVNLVKNASKVSNILNDVVGDICGIISGATVAVIIVKIASIYTIKDTLIITAVLNGFVAAITVGGKAFGKHIAMENASEIVRKAGYVSQFFSFSKKGK